jgi:hypothetical protein
VGIAGALGLGLSAPVPAARARGVPANLSSALRPLIAGASQALGWRDNFQGQLGDGTTKNSGLRVAASGLSEVTAIASGSAHSLAGLTSGSAKAWGNNETAELSDGNTTNGDVPVAVKGAHEVTVVSGGAYHSLAVGALIPVPTVTKVEPGSGPASGGTSVTISGTNFNEVTAVRFGSSNATKYTVNSTSSITATSPAGVGTQDVTVTTAVGTSETTAADQFSFGPTIAKIEPTKGATEGGTLVTITGANLAEATGVKFGSANATTFTVNSPTSMNAVSPAGGGTVDITVTTPEGTSPSSSDDRFAYEPPHCFGEGRGHNPVITAVEPSSGPAEASITIEGEHFSEVICGDVENNVRRVILGAEEASWSTLAGGSFNFLTFDHLKMNVIGGRGSDDTIQNSDIGNDPTGPAINIVEGDRWRIISNHIHDTGDSGILTQSAEEGNGQGANGITIEGNTIENTGSDFIHTFGKHGIYLKVRNARIVNNTITNCLAANADGISVRYGNSTITGNHISKCPDGIAFFQYDHEAGTSNWIENVISETTGAGIYVSPSDIGGQTRENFVIERNTIGPLTSGVYVNLGKTTGTYKVKENTLLGATGPTGETGTVGGTGPTGTSGGGVPGETGGGAAFYVSPNGSDSNPGTITEPWRTVGRVNSATLPAGSTVYFQGGASFAGTLVGNAGGEAGKPITYSSYGTGDATIGEVSVGGGSRGLSAVAPVGTGTVDVRVEMQNGATSATTSADRFTYTKPVPPEPLRFALPPIVYPLSTIPPLNTEPPVTHLSAAVISSATVSNRVWREPKNPRFASISRTKPPVGTTFSFGLDKPATVWLYFEQPTSGRLLHGTCVAGAHRHSRARKCARLAPAGTLRFAGHTGINSVHFEGRLPDGKKLKPGSYVLVLTATTPGAGSNSKTLTFAIVK